MQLVKLHRPFRTGIILGFGFMVAGLIVAAVLLLVPMALGVGISGLLTGLG